MSFLSFLSSHRLHSSHRPWIEPLTLRFDIILHENPSPEEIPDDAPEIARIEDPAAEAPPAS